MNTSTAQLAKRKYILTLFIFFISAIILTSCGNKNVTITYDLGYDEKVETDIVEIENAEKGILITLPREPFRPGYIFDGWRYTDSESGEEIKRDFYRDYLHADITLTAHWKRLYTTIYLDPNGGECDVEMLVLNDNESYKLPIPTRDGYYFDGWRSINGKDITEGIWMFRPIPAISAVRI